MLKGYATYANDITSKSLLANTSKASEDHTHASGAIKKSAKKLPPTSKAPPPPPGSKRDQAGSLGKSRDKLENSYNSSKGNRSGGTNAAKTPSSQQRKTSQERKLPKARDCMIRNNYNLR